MRDEFLAALAKLLTSADASAITPLLAPGAVVWHNYDGVDGPADEIFALAGTLPALVDELSFDVAKAFDLDGGFVAQFELTGVLKATGAPLRVRNCLFVWLDEDGRIRRMEEYLDPTFGAQLGAGEPSVAAQT